MTLSIPLKSAFTNSASRSVIHSLTVNSQLLSVAQSGFHVARRSVLYTAVHTILSAAVTTSIVFHVIDQTNQTLITANSTAKAPKVLTMLVAWSRASFLYRWFTAEPEPDVIVIDLRQTMTVGPWLSLLEQAITMLIPATHRSRMSRMLSAIHVRFQQRPVRVVSFVLLSGLGLSVSLGLVFQTLTLTGLGLRLLLLGLCLLGLRSSHSWEDLKHTTVFRLITAAFEPPDPPDSSGRS